MQMKFSASSRTASATVLLALIVTGCCTAAAVPVPDACRRLQETPVTTGEGGGDGRLQSQLSNLVATVEPVLRKFGVTKTVADLLDLDIIQRPRAVPGDLQSPLDQVVSELETVAKSIAGGPLGELPIDVLCQIIGLTSQLQSVVAALQDLPIVDGQGQLRTRMAALRSLLNGVQGQLQARGSAACAEQKP